MKNASFKKRLLASGSALQVLAFVGSGLAVATIATPAAAQDITSGTLTVNVTDANGAPIEGATVTILANERTTTRTLTTSSAGRVVFTQLPLGSYTISATNDVSSTRVPDASVALGGSSYSLALDTSAGGAEIVVSGVRARSLDSSPAATGIVLDVQETASRIPIPRTLSSLQLLAPQANAGDSAFGDGNLVSLGGASVAENIYYVNGMNVTNFRTGVGGSTVPFEFYDQVQVKTGGFQAEYGRTTGGAVIAVTRSGSNEFQGGFNAYYEPESMRSAQPNTYVANNEEDRVRRIEGNIYASGPIIKDHLYFFGFFNPRYSYSYGENLPRDGQTTYATSYVESDTPFWGGKIDADIVDGHRLEFTYFNDSNTTHTYAATLDGANGDVINPTNQYDFEGGSNYIGKYTGNFTDWLTVSALYGRSEFKRSSDGDAIGVPYTVDIRNPSAPVVLGGIGSLFDQGYDTRDEYRLDFDVYANFLGSHHFRFGVDYERLFASNQSAYSGGEIHYFYTATSPLFGGAIQPGQDYLRRIVYTNFGEFTSKNTAFYIQDNWDITDRFQLSLGLRNDRFQNSNANGDVFTDLKNQWAPRVGASFDVTGTGNTQLSAFYGRFYLPVAANTNIRMAGNEQYFQEYYLYTGSLLDPQYGGTPISRTVFSDTSADTVDPGALVSQNVKPQYEDQFILGIEQRLGDWNLALKGVYRNLASVLEDTDLGQYAIGAYCSDNLAACGGETSLDVGSGGYVLLNPGKDAIINVAAQGGYEGGVLTIPAEYVDLPKAKREYKALEFSFEKAWNGRFGLSGSYTLAWSKGNYEGGVKSDNGQDDNGLTQDFDEPGWMDGAYGYLPNDRRHSFKLFGSYALTDDILIGTNIRVSSPRKYGCLGIYPSTDGRAQDPFTDGGYDSWYCNDRSNVTDTNTNGDPTEGSGLGVLVGRGAAFESDWQKRVDLSFQYRPEIPNLGRATFRVDVYNIFNFHDGVDYNERGDRDEVYGCASGAATCTGADVRVPLNPDYGKVTQYSTPRYVRLGVSFDF